MTVYYHPTLAAPDAIPVSGSFAGQVIGVRSVMSIPASPDATLFRFLKIPAYHHLIRADFFTDKLDSGAGMEVRPRVKGVEVANLAYLQTASPFLQSAEARYALSWPDLTDTDSYLGYSDDIGAVLHENDTYLELSVTVAPATQTSGIIGVMAYYMPVDASPAWDEYPEAAQE